MFTSKPLAAFKFSNVTQFKNDDDLAKQALVASDHRRDQFAIANVDNERIYITGGRLNRNISSTNTTQIYNLAENNFTGAAPMNEARYSHSSTQVGQHLVVLGGRTNTES